MNATIDCIILVMKLKLNINYLSLKDKHRLTSLTSSSLYHPLECKLNKFLCPSKLTDFVWPVRMCALSDAHKDFCDLRSTNRSHSPTLTSLHPISYILIPYTLHPTPYPTPQPYTLHPIPYAPISSKPPYIDRKIHRYWEERYFLQLSRNPL